MKANNLAIDLQTFTFFCLVLLVVFWNSWTICCRPYSELVWHFSIVGLMIRHHEAVLIWSQSSDQPVRPIRIINWAISSSSSSVKIRFGASGWPYWIRRTWKFAILLHIVYNYTVYKLPAAEGIRLLRFTLRKLANFSDMVDIFRSTLRLCFNRVHPVFVWAWKRPARP